MKNVLKTAAVGMLLVSAGSAFAQSNPCNPGVSGEGDIMEGHAVVTPEPNPCQVKMGTVFYISDPMARNSVSFTSEAPLEDIVGTTSDVSGYVVFDPTHPSKGGSGELVVSVSSLETGIPLRDRHLKGPDWLDAANHNAISFRVANLRDVRLIKQDDGFSTFEMTAEGPFTLHGITREISVPIRATYLEESEQTKSKMPGNLLAARGSFDVSLKDFGIKGMKGVVGSKVGESIQVDISFIGTTMAMNVQQASNPGNPCGGKKAMNACNPCGG